MVQTEMTVAVARARSWCALGVEVTAAAKDGSDGADGGSGHGGGKKMGAQGHGGGNQGFSGKGEYEMII